MDPITTGVVVFGKGLLAGMGSEAGKVLVGELSKHLKKPKTRKRKELEKFIKACFEKGGILEVSKDIEGKTTIACYLLNKNDLDDLNDLLN